MYIYDKYSKSKIIGDEGKNMNKGGSQKELVFSQKDGILYIKKSACFEDARVS